MIFAFLIYIINFNKQIDVLKFVDDTVPLEGVQKSYERLTSGTDGAVKILVDPNL